MRRLAERPANMLFFAGSVIQESPLGFLWPKAKKGAEGRRVTDRRFLRVTEIFHSIQGESTWAGSPCTFVRLTGCPLRCVWCDTEYSFHGGEKKTLQEIHQEVDRIRVPVVEITGGEPLIHPNAFLLTRELLDRGYTVLVETSGAVDVGPSGHQGPQDHGPEVSRVRGGETRTSGRTWTTSLTGTR